METRSLSLTLPNHVWDALQQQDVPLEQAVAHALNKTHIPDPKGLSDAEIHDLKSRLGYKFDKAQSWAELQGRLKRAGFVLRDGRSGLALLDADSKEHICTIASLHISEAQLSTRFGRPFPKAAHRWLRDGGLSGEQRFPETQPDLGSKQRPISNARHG